MVYFLHCYWKSLPVSIRTQIFLIFDIFQYRNRRCLLDKECVNFSDYEIVRACYGTNSTIPKKACLKLLSKPSPEPGMCVKECPSGYKDDPYDIQKCIPCKGKCPKSKDFILLYIVWLLKTSQSPVDES